MNTVPIIGISRHRLATDGKGVTTLVAFHGCPVAVQILFEPTIIATCRNMETL